MTAEQERKERPYLLALAAGMGLLIGLALLLRGRVRPIWFDELFTYYAARRGSAPEVAQALLEGADSLPPLDPIIRHFSMIMVGPDELGFRLPSIVWFMLGSWWSYRAVYRISGSRLAAVAAFLIPTSTIVFEVYAVEGRPYVALFAVAAGALSAWSTTLVNPKAYIADVQLAVLLAAAIPLHYYGVIIPLAIAFGEVVRLLSGGKFRTQTLLAGLFAAALALTMIPFAQAATKQSSTHGWAPPRLGLIFWHFKSLLAPLVVPIVLGLSGAAAVQAVWGLPRKEEASNGESAYSGARAGWSGSEQSYATHVVRPFVAGTLAVVLTPVLVFGLALLTNTIVVRYSLPLVGGVAILYGLIVAVVAHRHRRVAQVLLAALVVVCGYRATAAAKSAAGAPIPGPRHGVDRIIEKYDGEIVVESAHLFFQEFYYLGEPRQMRLVRPIDVGLAVKYLGFDSDELALLDLRSTIHARFPDWSEYVAAHPKFILVSDNKGWILPWLLESGALVTATDRTLKSVVYRVDASAIVAAAAH